MNSPTLFLSEIDIHHTSPMTGNALREYIIMHSLFFNKLITGDSQFNNNPHLRSLLWDKEAPNSVNHPGDFSVFLKEGYLLPAIRKDYSSLNDVRKDHLTRGVANVPGKGYVDYLQDCLGGKRETFDLTQVSTIFRNRVLSAFSSQENTGRGKLSKQATLKVYEFVLSQEPLYFNSFRKWARKQINSGKMTEREYRLADKLVAGCYRHNIALSLDTNIDVSIAKRRDIYPFSVVMGNKTIFRQDVQNRKTWEISPKIIFMQNILSNIPAQVLIDIKGADKRKPLKRFSNLSNQLEEFRRGKNTNIETLVGTLEDYLAEVELVFLDYLVPKQRANYTAKKQKAKEKTYIKLFQDGTVFIIGLVTGKFLVDILHIGYGTFANSKEASLQEDFVDGYLVGRAINKSFIKVEKSE